MQRKAGSDDAVVSELLFIDDESICVVGGGCRLWSRFVLTLPFSRQRPAGKWDEGRNMDSENEFFCFVEKTISRHFRARYAGAEVWKKSLPNAFCLLFLSGVSV